MIPADRQMFLRWVRMHPARARDPRAAFEAGASYGRAHIVRLLRENATNTKDKDNRDLLNAYAALFETTV